MPASLADFLRDQRRRFSAQGVESPVLSAELLLARVLGLSREELLYRLIMNPGAQLDEQAEQSFRQLALRRLAGEPMAYLLGSREFYSRAFEVDRSTLIPRPETEMIVDEALRIFSPGLPGSGQGYFADLGTGSGCLAVTLALELPAWRGVAVDISPEALKVARRNATRLGAAERIQFAQADFRLPFLQPGCLELLVSNPPYVGEEEYRGLEAGVLEYEPKSALVPQDTDGAADREAGEAGHEAGEAEKTGLEDLAGVCRSAAAALKSGGLLLMEMGQAQGPYLREFLAGSRDWRETRILKDPAGLDRVLLALKR